MLRLLFRYALIPITAFILLAYATIPLWAPFLANILLKPYQWQEIELKVGYPRLNGWYVEQASWRHLTPTGNYVMSISGLSLGYSWQSIKANQWPHLDIRLATATLEAAPQSLSSAPSAALLPSQWLTRWPTFMVEKFNLDLTADGEQYNFSGQLENRPEGLGVLSKIVTPSKQQLYLDATFQKNDEVEAKLFATQSSAPVAKLTSTIKGKGSNYIWQGQGAINLAYGQKMLSHLLPLNLAETTITQGKVNSHWKISLPSNINEAGNLDFSTWLSQADGELQNQVQMAANNPNFKDLYVDASLTQIFSPNSTPQWRLNEGSTVRVTPAWDNTKIDPGLYQALLLEQAQLTFSAATPVIIEQLVKANLLGSKTGLRLYGDINATLENTHSVYQVFGQLSELQLHGLNHWQGIANLSGYYLAQRGASPWMAQLPIDLQQLQFISNVAFDFDPKQWQFNLQPNSKVSATQVVSRRQAGTVQLFASDKLNLTSDKIINLAYLPEQEYWSWSDISLHLKPESIPSQGLEINLGEGSSILTNRPIEGSFKLLPTLVNLPNLATFQAISAGQLTWFDGQLDIDFTSQLTPYINKLDGQYSWRADAADHQLLVQLKQVNLPPLMPQLNQLGQSIDSLVPLRADISRGLADYDGDWRWNDSQVSGTQTLSYSNVDGHQSGILVSGLTGKSKLDYTYATSGDQQSPLNSAKLIGDHKATAASISFGNTPNEALTNASLSMRTLGLTATPYNVDKFEAEWMGGQVFVNKASILPNQKNTLAVRLEDLELSRLVKLARTPVLKVTGEMSGSANLTLDLTKTQGQHFTLANADLSSTKTGTIEYISDGNEDQTEETAYLQQILSQFKYQKLSAKLSHNEDDKLELLTQFKGSNELFEAGQSVDFSLTLNPQLR